MVKVEKRLFDGTWVVSGHTSREEAEAHVQELRRTYEIGYGFWVKRPVEVGPDGTWSFVYDRGSSCD